MRFRSFKYASSSNEGTSLIQVMITIVVAMLLSASAVPALTRTAQLLRLMSVAKEIEGQLLNARFTAINRNNSASVIINSGGSWYFLDADGNGAVNGAETSMWVPAGGYTINSSTPSPALTSSVLGTSANPIALPNGGVAFTNRGTAVQVNSSQVSTTTKLTAPGVIYLRNPNGNYAAVTITPGGKVKSWILRGTTWRAW